MQKSVVVLLVDENECIREALGRLLGARGVPTQSFASGEECLDAVQRNRGPACVIADLRLPGMSGSELQTALPGRYPFIALTGHADVATAVATMQAGALDFLEKPIQDDRLLAAVGKALVSAQQLHEQALTHSDLQMRIDRLTPREKEVMSLVTTGMKNKEIARILGIVEKTIKVHRAHVMQKMELRSLADMVRCADSLGITVPADALPKTQ